MTESHGIDIPSEETWPSRSGFWRRLAAFFVDYLIVFVPIYLFTAVAFLLTDGGIKGSFSFTWQICRDATLNAGSDPLLAPYHWQVCTTSIFGLAVAQTLQGQATEKQASLGQSVSFGLDSQGSIRTTPLDVGFFETLILACYLFVMESKSGSPVGKRLLRIRVRDEDDFRRVGLPVKKSARRQAIKFFGAVPFILVQGWYGFKYWGTPPRVVQDVSTVETVMVYGTFALVVIWPIWIAASILLGNDPIHDRLTRTSVRADRMQT